ncbi:head-tail adaptor protein [Novosphingobium sp. AP12]|uniref:phage head completion protein n=1 Tax=Novosphingobium sp. AP12 TaxID=1144305 RepID=UPI000271DE00|nr:head-tail adaptor protein [Novosphingobium sp. AP12]EJL21898.1 bacteriophage head-tail adaptor [Novosphingobium sp. AP12]
MSIGKRDVFVIFEVREFTREPTYGTKVEGGWVKASDAWAEVQDVLPSRSENIDQNVNIQRRPARIRVDYFDGIDVTSSMRIDIDGRKLRIVAGPAEKGHRKEWEMMAEELSAEGHDP